MIKFKSKKTVPRYDEYNRHLGDFTMRMIINGLNIDGNQIIPHGFYYYINNEGQEITVAPIKNTSFPWANITQAEAQMPDFDANSLQKALYQRATEFAFIKWQMENGSSFGLMAEDWEIDVE